MFVENSEDIRANLKTMRDYLLSRDEDERFFARERLRRGYNLVSGNIDGDILFSPSRFIGYKDITIEKHRKLAQEHGLDGRETTPVINRILGGQTTGDKDWERLEALYLELCEKIDVAPDQRVRKFWMLDEVSRGHRTDRYVEGALSFYVSTRYERSVAARQACIEAHGLACVVCGLDFAERYGERGKGFIHVHHLEPISRASAKMHVCPAKDLVPVCPNCHYMIHRGDVLLSPEELKAQIKR